MAQQRLSAEQRRAQILDESQRLFIRKGYQATTMEDLLAAVGIAKGTLYHHFPSKEAILTALVRRTCERAAERARAAAALEAPPLERFFAVLAAGRVDDESLQLAEEFHAPGNAEFHLLSIVEMVRHLTPILADVVEQGNGTDFDCPQPREAVEILLTAGGMLLDAGVFDDGPGQAAARAEALMAAGTRLLGCAPARVAEVLGR